MKTLTPRSDHDLDNAVKEQRHGVLKRGVYEAYGERGRGRSFRNRTRETRIGLARREASSVAEEGEDERGGGGEERGGERGREGSRCGGGARRRGVGGGSYGGEGCHGHGRDADRAILANDGRHCSLLLLRGILEEEEENEEGEIGG